MATLLINLVSAQPANFTCKRGDTFEYGALRFWQDEAKTIKQDITSDTFGLKVKDADGEVVLSFSGGSEFVVANLNELTIKKTAALMAAVTANEVGEPYTYDLEWTKLSDGKVTTILKGTFAIEDDVTNAD